MDCAEFRDVLHELDRPGTRGAAAFESAMAHAEACGDCGILLVEEESLEFALHKVAHETARMPGAARVEAALLKEFRQAKPEAAAMASSWSAMRWRIAALGVAAAVLLVVGTVVYERNLTRIPGTVATNIGVNGAQALVDTKTVASSRAAEEKSAAKVRENPASVNAARPAAVAVLGAKQPAANEAEPTEYATAFVPLPYMDDPSALEGGSVVRVTLARSTLESYGLPADGMGAGDRVTADMVLSEDGTPQAIRLVSQAD
jgi:hypothetical protein